MERKCEHLLSYMANMLSKADKEKFEAHMKKCDACRKEYEELNDSWEALQFDFEEQHVPTTLKADVFDFVFESEEKEQKSKGKDRMKKWGILLKRQFTPLSASLVIILFAVMAVLTYTNVQSGSQQQSQPAEIMASLNLKSADNRMLEAGGYAYVVQEDDARKLIVQVDGLPKLEGSQIYQVWLLKDGRRLNAGIFNTDESGSGVLTHTLSEKEDFDQIGITREPERDNSQPEGEKVVGS